MARNRILVRIPSSEADLKDRTAKKAMRTRPRCVPSRPTKCRMPKKPEDGNETGVGRNTVQSP